MLNLLSRFVDSNERNVKRLKPFVDEINALEPEFEALSGCRDPRAHDRAARPDPRRRGTLRAVRRGAAKRRAPNAARDLRRAREKEDINHLQNVLDDALPEVFAAAREVSRRKLGMRPFDVQLMGAMVLHQGRISEMKTGEGKTLVAPLAAALNAMSGRGVHVVTVNDYLAKRDPQWMGPIFHGLGLSVGIIQHDSAFVFDPDYRPTDERLIHLRPVERARGLRGGRHLRHEQRVRLRLPARQHGHRPRRAGPARALLRHRRRGRQHPHRRGAHAAHHQRPGRGVGGPLLPVRAAGPAAAAAARGRRRRAATTSSTSRSTPSRPPRRASRRSRSCSRSTTCTTADPRLARHFEQALQGPRALQARPRLHRQGRRDRHRRRVHRPPDARPALVARACTRRSRPRKACASSASR